MGKRGPQPGATAKAAAAAKKAKAAPAAPKAQGTTTKRTPTGTFDPAAGKERVFSAAGKMHGDLQKAAKDSTLEHSLFAAFNTD